MVEAFKENNAERILKTSADLGHYVSDAHVPLHTTVNYNGQLTNQHGIHGFWESRLPELFGNNYDYFVGKAQYIENPLNFAWHAVFEAHNALDSVLRFEKELSQQFSADKKYSYEARGATTIRVYSREYSAAYHNRLQGQVERQMKKAILAVGSLWYSAWVDAGQPILQKHINKQQPQPEKQQTDEEQQEYEGGHWLGRPE